MQADYDNPASIRFRPSPSRSQFRTSCERFRVGGDVDEVRALYCRVATVGHVSRPVLKALIRMPPRPTPRLCGHCGRDLGDDERSVTLQNSTTGERVHLHRSCFEQAYRPVDLDSEADRTS